jgi:enoyl-CoA hydratase
LFGEPELKFGAGIVVMILPWLAGPNAAKELAFTGAEFSATRALELRLVNRLVPAECVHTEAMALAARIAVVDPELVKATKRAINRAYEIMGLGRALDEALAIDLEIEGNSSIDKQRFMDVARTQGLRAAIAWRDARFAVPTAERLEKFKRPDVIHFGRELPLGPTGKADRGALRRLLAEVTQ